MVVHARAEHLARVREDIEQLPGAEVHAQSDNGKLVVVLETERQGYITDIIDKINSMEQVLNTALVYHQIEQLDSLETEKL